MPLLASLFRRPGAARPGAQRPRPEANRFRPRLETLEDRTVPVLISSQVGGVSFVFSNVNSFVATFVQSTVATNTQGFVPVACPSNVPSQFQDCIQMFESMGLTSPVKKNQGNGQQKFWVCHMTGSQTNPHVFILVAQPAAFGGHLRHGDLVFSSDSSGVPLVTFLQNGQVVTLRLSAMGTQANACAPASMTTPGSVPSPMTMPSGFQDCVAKFKSMGLTSPVKKNQGNGQDKFWVCHFTGSSTNPYVLILVAQPAAFGGHLRQGDMVLTTNGGTTFGTFLNEQGQVVTQPV
jgi:hypothetical protein